MLALVLTACGLAMVGRPAGGWRSGSGGGGGGRSGGGCDMAKRKKADRLGDALRNLRAINVKLFGSPGPPPAAQENESMNTISVIAHGSPGSFARRVQANPQMAVELLRELDAVLRLFESDDKPDNRTADGAAVLVAIPREHAGRIMRLIARCYGNADKE